MSNGNLDSERQSPYCTVNTKVKKSDVALTGDTICLSLHESRIFPSLKFQTGFTLSSAKTLSCCKSYVFSYFHRMRLSETKSCFYKRNVETLVCTTSFVMDIGYTADYMTTGEGPA